MKNNRFIRRIDSMGRIVIPRDLRKELNIQNDDVLQLSYEDHLIKIERYLYDDKIDKLNKFINYTFDLLNLDIIAYSNTSSLKDYINNQRDYYSINKETINNKEGYHGIIRLTNDNELVGILFVSKQEEFNELDKLYISIIKRYVENINYL